MGCFVSMKVNRKVVDEENKLVEYKYRYCGEHVSTVLIDLINDSFEVIDGGFDDLPIPEENIPNGKTRKDLILRNIV